MMGVGRPNIVVEVSEMCVRFGRIALLSAVLFIITLACGSHTPPLYDSPPTLANREEITDALRAVGAGLEAQVVLLVRVGDQGEVREVEIAESSGVESLDDAALWIGRQMRFDPARYQGEPVAALVRLPLTFDVVSRVTRPVRLRNGDEIVRLMVRDHGDIRGTARFRVHVSADGWPVEVESQGFSDPAALEVARPYIDELQFRPAYKGSRSLATWIDLVFVFAGPQSRVTIQSDDS